MIVLLKQKDNREEYKTTFE